MNRVFLLGSGFSRAISDDMLLTRGLTEAVQNRLEADGLPPMPKATTPIANDFEQWLSYLIESPPWLTEAEQARNRAAFLDVSKAVHDVLSECQDAALMNSDCPPWLAQLVHYWQETSATVITFNYDCFVELAWKLHAAPKGRSWIDLYPVPVEMVARRAHMVFGSAKPSTGLRLLKLHGSLNWRYSGPDSTPGDIVYDVGVKGDEWTPAGVGPAWPDADQLAADREPMIVPPAALKSPYYGNRTLRALWRLAGQALSEAEELVIIGFSLPPSDTLVSSMLATTLPEDSFLTPVNRSGDVAQRIRDTFDIPVGDSRLTMTFVPPSHGDDALSAWVATFANLGP